MKLQTLRLKNFKGIREFTLPANGEDINIYGANRTGKTTIADALMWLLFGKDLREQKNFGIQTHDENGEPLHNLSHEVEAVLETESGEVALKKVYFETWERKKGSLNEKFTGHTTDHFVNGVA